MDFFKRIWFLALAGLIILSLATHVFLRKRTQGAPITIYKTVTPVPKSRPLQTDTAATQSLILHDYNHNHPHDPSFHDQATVPPARQDNYDWQDDSTFDTLLPTNDPWKYTYPERGPTDATDDTYPPWNWYKTEDPVLRAEYYGAQMLKQFGDIPEVHTVSDWELKKAIGIIPTHEELIIYLEALYHLFPREGTLHTLNYHRELRSKGVQVKMIPEGDPR